MSSVRSLVIPPRTDQPEGTPTPNRIDVNSLLASTATLELADLPEIKHRISEIEARGSSLEVSRLLCPTPSSEALRPVRSEVAFLLCLQVSYQALRVCSHGRVADVLSHPGRLRAVPSLSLFRGAHDQ